MIFNKFLKKIIIAGLLVVSCLETNSVLAMTQSLDYVQPALDCVKDASAHSLDALKTHFKELLEHAKNIDIKKITSNYAQLASNYAEKVLQFAQDHKKELGITGAALLTGYCAVLCARAINKSFTRYLHPKKSQTKTDNTASSHELTEFNGVDWSEYCHQLGVENCGVLSALNNYGELYNPLVQVLSDSYLNCDLHVDDIKPLLATEDVNNSKLSMLLDEIASKLPDLFELALYDLEWNYLELFAGSNREEVRWFGEVLRSLIHERDNQTCESFQQFKDQWITYIRSIYDKKTAEIFVNTLEKIETAHANPYGYLLKVIEHDQCSLELLAYAVEQFGDKLDIRASTAQAKTEYMSKLADQIKSAANTLKNLHCFLETYKGNLVVRNQIQKLQESTKVIDESLKNLFDRCDQHNFVRADSIA